MSALSISTGLISGLDFDALVEASTARQQASITRLESQVTILEGEKTGLSALEAGVLSLSTAGISLKNTGTFEALAVTNSNTDALKVTTSPQTIKGNYSFRTIQKSSNHQVVSGGFIDADDSVGTGTLVIANGGELNSDTLLEVLNGGSGIRRGSIRITDRAGGSETIDLSDVLSVNDVLERINAASDIQIEAITLDGGLVLEDLSGGTGSISVVDLNGGNVAQDLGIAGSVAADTLTGTSIYTIDESFTFDLLNDGNQPRLQSGASDIRITVADGSTIDVNLDDSRKLSDVINAINEDSENDGLVTASLHDGRLVLEDSTTGGETLRVEDLNGSSVVRQFGLDATASGSTLTGNRLTGGLNSVLLRNLNGGQGIETLGEISLTDRAGNTATIDLAGAESLDEVLAAINSAEDNGTPLELTARISGSGAGIEIVDTSGATAGNLIIADVNGGTTAADLGIAIDDAVTEVASGSLGLRYVNEATSVSNYAPDGGGITAGSIEITDSAGNVGIISISSAVKNVGDVITRINANSSIQVTAELNETGDGFVLIDEAGGGGTLTVGEVDGGSTAADLRLTGEAVTGDDSKQRISSRFATVIEITEEDTIGDVVTRINQAGSRVSASLVDDGSSFNPTRLSLVSSTSGRGGKLVIDDGGLNLGFGTIAQAKDAILQLGDDPTSSFLISSSTNRFEDVVTGIDVEILQGGSDVIDIDIQPNTTVIQQTLENFVTNFNTLANTADELTKFDTDNNQRGILQGDTFVPRVVNRITSVINRQLTNGSNEIDSLADLGIRFGAGGRLVLDKEALASALANNFDAVSDFFIADDLGFGQLLDDAVVSLTDSIDGSFKVRNNSIDTTVQGLEDRIEDLTVLLDARKVRLFNEFVAMEEAISSINSQQDALTALQPVQSNSNNK